MILSKKKLKVFSGLLLTTAFAGSLFIGLSSTKKESPVDVKAVDYDSLVWYWDDSVGTHTANDGTDTYYASYSQQYGGSITYYRTEDGDNEYVEAECSILDSTWTPVQEYVHITYDLTSAPLIDTSGTYPVYMFEGTCSACNDTESLSIPETDLSIMGSYWDSDGDSLVYVHNGDNLSYNIVIANVTNIGAQEYGEATIEFAVEIEADTYETKTLTFTDVSSSVSADGLSMTAWCGAANGNVALIIPNGSYLVDGWNYYADYETEDNILRYYDSDYPYYEYSISSIEYNERSSKATINFVCDSDSDYDVDPAQLSYASYMDDRLSGDIDGTQLSINISTSGIQVSSIVDSEGWYYDNGTLIYYVPDSEYISVELDVVEYHYCSYPSVQEDFAYVTYNIFDNGAPYLNKEQDNFFLEKATLTSSQAAQGSYTLTGYNDNITNEQITIRFNTNNLSAFTEVHDSHFEWDNGSLYFIDIDQVTREPQYYSGTLYPNGEPANVIFAIQYYVGEVSGDSPYQTLELLGAVVDDVNHKVTGHTPWLNDDQEITLEIGEYDIYVQPGEHNGWWFDESTHKIGYFDPEYQKELTVITEVMILDFGPNTGETRGTFSAQAFMGSEYMNELYQEIRTFTVGTENGKRFIVCQINLEDGAGLQTLKVYPDSIYYNQLKPGLNYAEGYNQIWYLTDDYYGAIVEPNDGDDGVIFNATTRVFMINAWCEDVTGQQDLLEFTIKLTDGVVQGNNGYQDGQTIEGYWSKVGKRIKLNVFNITYALEEESISNQTITAIGDAMTEMGIDSSAIVSRLERQEVKSQVPESTGGVIVTALNNTASDLSSDPTVKEKQQDVIAKVVDTVIDLVTNKPSDVGLSIRTDYSLPANAGLSLEQEVREFYDLQLAELIGGYNTKRRITRATDSDYRIDVANKSKEELEKDLEDFENMLEFIDDSVQNMNTAGRKLRICSGEKMKVEINKTVKKIKTSSFRDFDKTKADLQFAYDVHDAMMLHLQEVVVKELEKDYKPSGNREKDQQYQEELDACKDIESFTEIVIEVLRQKYNKLTRSDIKQGKFGEKGKGIYWKIFEAWCLDYECPYPITFQELTDSTVEVTTRNARSFELSTKVTNTEIIFTAAFIGGSVAFVSLAGVLGYVLKKRSLRGLIK